jgi:hypothetical protein
LPAHLKFANDGKRLFFFLHGGDFDVDELDVLLAKKSGLPDNEYCRFVGKPLRDVVLHPYGKANQFGVSGRIFSVPLEFAVEPHVVFGARELAKEGRKFLVHEDMDEIGLSSGSGFVRVTYNPEAGEFSFGASIDITEGQYAQEVPLRTGFSSEERLWIHDLPTVNRGIYACMVVPNRELCEPPNYINIPIAFKGGEDVSGRGILYVCHKDNKVYALYAPVHNRSKKTGWALKVERPAFLVTYRMELAKTVPAESS